jgi:hypothetical protein
VYAGCSWWHEIKKKKTYAVFVFWYILGKWHTLDVLKIVWGNAYEPDTRMEDVDFVNSCKCFLQLVELLLKIKQN